MQIRGEKVIIRTTTHDDLANVMALWNDGRVMQWVGFPNGLNYDKVKISKWFWLALGAAAGITATTAAFILLGNQRLDKWETLTQDDADEGDFVTLSDRTCMHDLARHPATVALGQEAVVGGPSSAVILIHGLMDSAQQWSKNIDVLAQAHRVWAIDLIGFGFSSRVTTPMYSMKMFARSIREFMDVQGIAAPASSVIRWVAQSRWNSRTIIRSG